MRKKKRSCHPPEGETPHRAVCSTPAPAKLGTRTSRRRPLSGTCAATAMGDFISRKYQRADKGFVSGTMFSIYEFYLLRKIDRENLFYLIILFYYYFFWFYFIWHSARVPCSLLWNMDVPSYPTVLQINKCVVAATHDPKSKILEKCE